MHEGTSERGAWPADGAEGRGCGRNDRRDRGPRHTRREVIAGCLATTAAAWLPRAASAESKTRLILLGTGGGPRPRKVSSGAAQAIVVNGATYVVDCGDGVARQLASADVPLPSLKSIFITHNHSDHNADYGNLMLLAWTAGLRTRVDTYGPPPIERMTRLFLEMNAFDIETRIKDEGRPPLAPLIHPHEVRQGGPVMQDANVKVTAALVNHPPVTPAFGYRFDTADRSIVISGDTTPTPSLISLAAGADVLVHEAMFMPGIERLAARVPNAATLRQSMLSHHTRVEDAGRVAREAGVKLLVLSHLVPPDDSEITEQMWLDAARKEFSGPIVVGRDLLEI
jgi:ribonuclease BN (tRNA processing enzyme)